MLSRYIAICLLAGFVILSACPASAQSTGSEGSKLVDQLQFEDISWDIPKLGVDVAVDTLPNGLVLFMMEDHRLPVLNIRALIKTGRIYIPNEKRGLAGLVGSVMRTGGTETMEPEMLNEELEYIAASIETSVDDESASARLNCMSKDIDKGLQLFADVLMNPAFRQDKIELQKSKSKESIRRRNDSPGSICRREFYHLLYGDHPYGYIQEWQSLATIDREDLMAFHSKYFVPNNTWFGVTGDFEIPEMREKIKTAFKNWKPEEIDWPTPNAVKNEPNPGVFLVDKDITQSNIRFGVLGVDQHNEDVYAIAIMNYILGGGSFTSRMTSEVRSNMGLAYSVGTSFSTGSPDLGTFNAFCQTKTTTTNLAVSEMVKQINGMKEKMVTEYELNSAKDSFINRFVFRFTDPANIVNRLMNIEFYGMPRDYYETYLDNVRQVSKEDVLRVAQKYLNVDNMTFLVVGDTEGFDAPLDDFGAVTMLEVKDPIIEE